MIRRVWLAEWVAALLLASCGGDEEPRCRIAQAVVLPAVAAQAAVGQLQLGRAGDDFVLLSRENGPGPLFAFNYRLQRLSAAGVMLGGATASAPQSAVVSEAAATAKTAPADQLVVVHSSGTPGDSALQTTVAGLDGSPALSRPLLDPEGQPVVAPPATGALIALGTSRTGRRAVLAWGDARRPEPPRILLIKGDGATEPTSLAIAPGPPWDCLAVVPGRHDFAVQRVLRPDNADPTWLLLDMRDDGTVAYSLQVPLPLEGASCPKVAPTPTGYTIAWQNREGSYFSDIVVDGRPQPFVTTDIVRAAVRFGGADRQPPISCIAFMGRDYGLVFGSPRVPLVHRFDVFGVPRGGQLHLPSAGRVGPVAAWPDVGAAFVSYLELGANGGELHRHFLKVDCPN